MAGTKNIAWVPKAGDRLDSGVTRYSEGNPVCNYRVAQWVYPRPLKKICMPENIRKNSREKKFPVKIPVPVDFSFSGITILLHY